MKKLFLIVLCLGVGVAARAQFCIGAGMAAHGTRFNEQYSSGAEHEGYYCLGPTLRVGYHWANGLSAGLDAEMTYLHDSRRYGYNSNVQPAMDDPAKLYSETSLYYDEKLTWTAGGWLRYDLPLTSRLTVFANLSVGGGSLYGRGVHENWEYSELTGQRELHRTERSTYGNRNNTVASLSACLTPGVACRLGSHWQAELWLDLLQISYRHFTVWQRAEGRVLHAAVDAYDYDGKADGNVTEQHLDMFYFGSRSSDWLVSGSTTSYPQPSGGMFHLGCTYMF